MYIVIFQEGVWVRLGAPPDAPPTSGPVHNNKKSPIGNQARGKYHSADTFTQKQTECVNLIAAKVGKGTRFSF